jgi:hypothetical protein
MLGPASLNFVSASIAAFLTPMQQQRVRRVQYALLAAGGLYVAMYLIGHFNHWF